MSRLFNVNTPTEELFFDLFTQHGVRVVIKRDDLIHPFVSGNKWRKLKYNFKEAERLRATKILTFGGAYSNHLIATAVACAKLGMESIGVVRGEELDRSSNFVLRLCDEHGMKLRFVSRSAYGDSEAMHNLIAEEENCFAIPEGGDNEFGVKGCEEILPIGSDYNHVFVPVGTSTTMRGVMRSAKPSVVVHGIAALNQAEYLNSNILSEPGAGILHTNCAFGGFGKYDDQQLEFNRVFAAQTGILLDPIYTGKMMRCLFELIKQDYFPRGARILCIHTGGLTGVLSNQWLMG